MVLSVEEVTELACAVAIQQGGPDIASRLAEIERAEAVVVDPYVLNEFMALLASASGGENICLSQKAAELVPDEKPEVVMLAVELANTIAYSSVLDKYPVTLHDLMVGITT